MENVTKRFAVCERTIRTVSLAVVSRCDVLSKFLPMWPIVQHGFVCLVYGIYSAVEGVG